MSQTRTGLNFTATSNDGTKRGGLPRTVSNLRPKITSTMTNPTNMNLSVSNQESSKTRPTRQLSTLNNRSNLVRAPSKVELGPKRTLDKTSSNESLPDKRAKGNTSNSATTYKPKVKKPAPWDTKARLEIMERKMREDNERITKLENLNQNLNSAVQEKENVVAQNQIQTQNLSSKVTQLDEENRELQDKLRAKNRLIEDLEFNQSSSKRRIKALEDELEVKDSELRNLRTTVGELTSSTAGMEIRLKTTENSLKEARKMIEELETLTTAQHSTIEVYQENQRNHETERRKLHNIIQELKGNIRVFCRVRPDIIPDLINRNDYSSNSSHHVSHIAFTGEKSLEMIRGPDKPGSTSSSVSGKSEKFSFEFDHVFTDAASQECIFEEVSQLVQSSIDGYNVCIFAYGQTGSGKTYTMEGEDNDGDRGIIPRALLKIYQEASSLQERGWRYQIHANFVEIYNEEIRDLLTTEKGLKHEIKRMDSKSDEIYVTNLQTEDVTDGENIDQLLCRAKRARAVAATNCNERSSRSHSVFILKIQGSNDKTGETCSGSLNLVDLAGSERLKDSGSTGIRLEETKNINTSLSNLSKVILALANKDAHIPYRDSKLTHLLMNSLGGNSKTLMFVNLSPKIESFNESLNSLRFAKRVNQCQIGTASKKIAL